jgi:hypothetical protein
VEPRLRYLGEDKNPEFGRLFLGGLFFEEEIPADKEQRRRRVLLGKRWKICGRTRMKRKRIHEVEFASLREVVKTSLETSKGHPFCLVMTSAVEPLAQHHSSRPGDYSRFYSVALPCLLHRKVVEN